MIRMRKVLAWAAVGALWAGAGCVAQVSPAPPAAVQDTTVADDAKDKGAFCGGIAGIQCAEGLVCVDDPSDDCDPAQGGRDCGGICVKDKDKDKCKDPARKYVSEDPDTCAALRFVCEEGYTAFFDKCGCGCEPTSRG